MGSVPPNLRSSRVLSESVEGHEGSGHEKVAPCTQKLLFLLVLRKKMTLTKASFLYVNRPIVNTVSTLYGIT